MAKAKKKKDKFSKLDDDFKAEIEALKKVDIDKRIAEWAKLIETTAEQMKADDDLTAKREAARFASAPYWEDIRMAKLRIAFGMRILMDRGSS
ncbi:hypothetical protein KAR91_54900 [Candidatus Pacearchaeota archaeon]|nr:hypothetical protein [Candidatus Pacearchaeota archaeon]